MIAEQICNGHASMQTAHTNSNTFQSIPMSMNVAVVGEVSAALNLYQSRT